MSPRPKAKTGAEKVQEIYQGWSAEDWAGVLGNWRKTVRTMPFGFMSDPRVLAASEALAAALPRRRSEPEPATDQPDGG